MSKPGQPKPTQPANQARQWFSHALLAAMLMRGREPAALIAFGFPDFGTFRSLIQRSESSLSRLGIGVFLVNEAGAVMERLRPQLW